MSTLVCQHLPRGIKCLLADAHARVPAKSGDVKIPLHRYRGGGGGGGDRGGWRGGGGGGQQSLVMSRSRYIATGGGGGGGGGGRFTYSRIDPTSDNPKLHHLYWPLNRLTAILTNINEVPHY